MPNNITHIFVPEAQYAANKKKHIVPLKYEDHEPSGWLGIMINALLYYDVSTDAAMLTNLPNIIRALDNKGVSRRFGSKSFGFFTIMHVIGSLKDQLVRSISTW